MRVAGLDGRPDDAAAALFDGGVHGRARDAINAIGDAQLQRMRQRSTGSALLSVARHILQAQ